MKTTQYLGLTVVLAAFLGIGSQQAARAADAAKPATLWNILGIPQGLNKIRDDLTNRRGNFPKLERKPKLKAIADAVNIESKNPAIKAAAEAKAEADLAPQKIKAIKYLAKVGCGCPSNKEDVRNALLAALDDCTEKVRYEAAIAFCESSGNPCTLCNSGSCCSAEVMNKLNQMANEQDDQGCWLEPSQRVRAAASNALNACRRVRLPSAAPLPPEKRERRIDEGPTPVEKRAAQTQLPAPGAVQSATLVSPAAIERVAYTSDRPAETSLKQPTPPLMPVLHYRRSWGTRPK